MSDGQERLQKILARAGYGSRRACEELIKEGRVRVNGQPAELGSKADASKDEIRLDGHLIHAKREFVYIALNKPRGVVSTTRGADNRRTVIDIVGHKTRLYPVGRLDIESEGLMLLTNDGDFTNTITHPRYGHQKEYRVLVAKRPDNKQLKAWRVGVVLEDGYRTAPAEVWVEKTKGKGAWMRVIIGEGRKRQIREMARQTGLPVVKLIRVRIGTLELGSLEPGKWRELSEDEVKALSKKNKGTAPQKGPR
ncbi:MAG: rRNA pseudouridine synthase [Anaerolineae bacterium]|nr:rRNA pseudouridine synthase [Anaerolineae bacterium]